MLYVDVLPCYAFVLLPTVVIFVDVFRVVYQVYMYFSKLVIDTVVLS